MGNGSHVTIEAVILIACFHMGKNVYVLLRSVQSIVIDSMKAASSASNACKGERPAYGIGQLVTKQSIADILYQAVIKSCYQQRQVVAATF